MTSTSTRSYDLLWLGLALLVLLPQLLTVFHEYEHIMLGVVMMLVMIFLPAGIIPSLAARFGRR